MKKVLFTATVDSHILQFHLPFLRYFKENGYVVHVATNGDKDIPFCDKKIIVPFERSPYNFNNIKAIRVLKKVIDSEKYDIVHTHTPMGSVVTRLASISSRKKGTRVIYTAHGFHFYKGAPLKNWLLFYSVEKFLSRFTDTLITINKEDYNLARRKFKKCKDIHYVPGVGIDSNKFNFKMSKKEIHNLRKSLGLKDSDFVMIFPAELNYNKNQSLLINVMDSLVKNNDKFHLLLPGLDSFHGYYQKLVLEKKLNRNVHFLGYRNDIPKLLKISNLVVSSSLREGLPVNVMEAFSSGLPVVALHCRGMSDLIVDGVNGYIVNDEKGFIEKIILVSKKKWNIILDKKFSIDNIINNMSKIYKG